MYHSESKNTSQPTPLFQELPVIRIFIFHKNERSFINLQLCQERLRYGDACQTGFAGGMFLELRVLI